MENENNTLNAVVPDTSKKVGTYLGWLVLSALPSFLPVIGLVVVIVLAFAGRDVEKKRFFKASLLLYAILLFVAIAIGVTIFAMFGEQLKPFFTANY